MDLTTTISVNEWSVILMNLPYTERIPFSQVSRYLRQLFREIHPSTVNTLLRELEYLNLNTTIIHDFFDGLDTDPRVRAGLLIAGQGLRDVLSRTPNIRFNFEIIQATYEEDGYYHPGFDEELLEGKLSVTGCLMAPMNIPHFIPKGLSSYYFRTVAYKVKDVPRYLLDFDISVGTVLMTPQGFYFQRPDDYLTRTRQIHLNPLISHRLKVRYKDTFAKYPTLKEFPNQPRRFFNQFYANFTRICNALCAYVQDTREKVDIEIDGRRALNRFELWYDCVMFYNLEIFRPVSLGGREIGGDYIFIRNQLLKREKSQYEYGQRRQQSTIGYHKVHRIYPTLASWQLRYYNVDTPTTCLALEYYEGDFDLNEIRRFFGI